MYLGDRVTREQWCSDRFDVVRCLGEGANGVVYDAFDRDQKCRVAVKRLARLSGDALHSFKQEFRTRQGIEHPNLVHLGELIEHKGEWFFTMELVEGQNFVRYVRDQSASLRSAMSARPRADGAIDAWTSPSRATSSPPPGSTEDLSDVFIHRVRHVTIQLVRGLMALHAAGKVHRDVKPSNVLVTRTGRLVLLDFGLVKDLQQEDIGEVPDMAGSVQYMSPEQAAALPVGFEADFYGVGGVLYEALTGQPPFTGSVWDVMVAKRKQPPPPPRSIVQTIPAEMDQLCSDLLQVNPKARPRAEQILAILEDSTFSIHVNPRPKNSSSPGSLWVGRDKELTELHNAFQTCVERQETVAVLVEGESGLGKTALAHRFVGNLRAIHKGVVVLAGRCYERESVPFKAMDGVVDALCRFLKGIRPEEVTAILPHRAALLAEAFPVLQRVSALEQTARARDDRQLEPQELRSRMFRAMRELLARLGDRQALVLLVDDLQWADADSMALLDEVLRPPEAPSLLLIATARSGIRASGRNALRGNRVFPCNDFRHIVLQRLEPKDAEQLARHLVDSIDEQSVVDARVIAKEAEGHPLFIQELIRHAAMHGGTGTASASLDDVLRARIVELPRDTRRILELVALAGAPIATQVIEIASSMARADLSRCLATLRAANLVQTASVNAVDSVRTYHDRVREALVNGLEPKLAKERHRALALALEIHGTNDAELLALHWYEAGDFGKAILHGVKAASAAEESLAFDHAARLYRMALGWTEQASGDPRPLRIKLANALSKAGRGGEAGDLFELAAQDAEAAKSLDLMRRAAEEHLCSGHVDKGLAAIRDVLSSVGLRLPRSSVQALFLLLFRRVLLRVRGMDFVARTENDLGPRRLRRIDACLAVAKPLSLIDTIRGAEFNSRTLLMALEYGEPTRLLRSLVVEVIHTASAGVAATARRETLLDQTWRLANSLERTDARAWAFGGSGMSAYFLGKFRQGAEDLQKSESLFREVHISEAFEASSVRLYLVTCLAHLGKLAEVERRVSQYLHEAEDRGNLYFATGLCLGMANLGWLIGDDVATARRIAKEASERWSYAGFHLQHWWGVQAHTHLDLFNEPGGVALELLEKRWGSLSKSMLLRVQTIRLMALHLRARCAVAAARETKGSQRLSHMHHAKNDGLKMLRDNAPWGNPLARLVLACVSLLEGSVDSAVSLLEQAALEFDECNMELYACAARFRAGQVIAGDTGQCLIDESTHAMNSLGIKSPSRWVRMLAPGFDDG